VIRNVEDEESDARHPEERVEMLQMVRASGFRGDRGGDEEGDARHPEERAEMLQVGSESSV